MCIVVVVVVVVVVLKYDKARATRGAHVGTGVAIHIHPAVCKVDTWGVAILDNKTHTTHTHLMINSRRVMN